MRLKPQKTMTRKASKRRENNQHSTEQFTAIAKTFEKIKSKPSSGAVGNAALNSGQQGRAKVEISPQGCASLDDLRILSSLVYQSAIPGYGAC
jgi:hypothetical protein